MMARRVAPHFRGMPAVVMLLAIAFVGDACSAAPVASPGAGSGQPVGLTVTTEGLVLSPDVTAVDKSTAASHLTAVGDDGQLTFDADTPGLADVAPGDVLVIEGVGVRLVTKASRDGSKLTVATAEASIADAIQDGKLSWRYDIAWDNLPDATYETAMAAIGLRRDRIASAIDLDPQRLRLLAVPGETLRFTGKVQGFDVEFKLVPRSDKLEFELAATRSNVKVQAAGFISTFVQETVMEFDGGSGTFFDTSVRGLKGEAEVTWNAFQVNDPSLDSDIVALNLPFGVPIPFMAGPIPMTLHVKANIRVVPELTSGNASSGGSWKVTYDSDHGFNTNGGDPTPISQLRNLVADLGKEPTVTAGLGVVGFGVGVEFPRLELQLGHPVSASLLGVEGGPELYEKASSLLQTYAFLTLNTYVSGLWTPGTTLTGDIPPCQRSSAVVSAIAGYRLAVLGMVELSDNKVLWQKTIDRFKDDKPCTLTGE